MMKFASFYGKGKPVISFELFPPRTEQGLIELLERLPRLISLKPSFITVTYGAMGSTRDRTLEIAATIQNRYGMETAHHLTCVGSSRDQIDAILADIRLREIENIVALRGDPPQGETFFRPAEGGYRYAEELVRHIRTSGDFSIAVAGYPEKHLEAESFEADLLHLKRKVEAGADVVITQLFFDNRSYYSFVRSCREIGIDQPIIPGLMPIQNVKQIRRITRMCGATIPPGLLSELLESESDEQRTREIGIRHTVEQARDLLDHGVKGIHFYVLNRCFQISEIMQRIQATSLSE